ncbi:MAG: sugar ABC transporter substrate-binding protein, partial [Candidatus Omnitrophota bacterium]|nr:sugar ABC transporter substrate-binding protein [Candidatus Omnitrophota bacterium]
MNSILRIITTALVVFSLGCGKGDGHSGATTIKVAYWGGPEEIVIIQDLIADWQTSHPDVRVRLEHTPFSAYVSRLLTRMAGNVAPDIMAVEVNMFPSLWAKGAFQSLQPFIDRDTAFDIEEFFPEVLDRFSIDEAVYAIPRDTAPFACVYYNKKLFDEAKLPYPTDDWDWDDLLHLSKTLTKTGEDGRVSQYGFYAWAWQNFVYSNGGKLVDDLYHPTTCLLGQPKAVEGLQFYADLMNTHKVAPTPVALGNLAMGAQQLFMMQRVAMFSSGYWEVPILRQIKDFEWDVVMFPKGKGGRHAFGTGGTGYAMLKSSSHPTLAWEVLKSLAGREAQARLAQTGLAQPANRVVAEGPAFALAPEPPANKAMLNDAVQHVVYEPFIPQWREIFELYILPELDLVFNGKR